jgi:hypothetical protein
MRANAIEGKALQPNCCSERCTLQHLTDMFCHNKLLWCNKAQHCFWVGWVGPSGRIETMGHRLDGTEITLHVFVVEGGIPGAIFLVREFECDLVCQ